MHTSIKINQLGGLKKKTCSLIVGRWRKAQLLPTAHDFNLNPSIPEEEGDKAPHSEMLRGVKRLLLHPVVIFTWH